MADRPADVMKPWATKRLPRRVGVDIAATAKRENLTTGQLLERVWEYWKRGGSPLPVADLSPGSDPLIADLAVLLTSTAYHPKIPAEVKSLINQMAQKARFTGSETR